MSGTSKDKVSTSTKHSAESSPGVEGEEERLLVRESCAKLGISREVLICGGPSTVARVLTQGGLPQVT